VDTGRTLNSQTALYECIATITPVAVVYTWPQILPAAVGAVMVMVLKRRRVSFSLPQTCAVCLVPAVVGLSLGLRMGWFAIR
jgi:hypothetical protein